MFAVPIIYIIFQQRDESEVYLKFDYYNIFNWFCNCEILLMMCLILNKIYNLFTAKIIYGPP